jgi:hypothetical protein
MFYDLSFTLHCQIPDGIIPFHDSNYVKRTLHLVILDDVVRLANSELHPQTTANLISLENQAVTPGYPQVSALCIIYPVLFFFVASGNMLFIFTYNLPPPTRP